MDFHLSPEHISQQTSPKLDSIIPPVTLTLAKSFSEDAIQSPNANYLMVDDKYSKLYHSASEVNYDTTTTDLTSTDEFYSQDDEDIDINVLPNKNSTMIQYTQSEVNLNALSHQKAQRSKRKHKKKRHKNLSREDVMRMFNKERKKSHKYRQQSIKLQDKFTDIADDYEDQLKHNEDEIKQEYELKLLEAEIKKKQLEQEVQRLKQMLITNDTRSSPRYSLQSTNSIDFNAATVGPVPLAHARAQSANDVVLSPINISPIHRDVLYHQHHQAHSDTSSNHGHITPLTMTQTQEQIGGLFINVNSAPVPDATAIANILSFSQLSLPLNENQVFVDEGISPGQEDEDEYEDDDEVDALPVIRESKREMSMDDRLRAQMSPCVNNSVHQLIHSVHDFSNLPAYSLDGYQQYPEGSDTDHNNDSNNDMNRNYDDDDAMDGDDESSSIQSSDTRSYESSPSPTPSPDPPQRKYKKGKKKKKKRIKEPKSFWDVLIKCVTPTLCEVE